MRVAAFLLVCSASACMAQTLRIEPAPKAFADAFRQKLANSRGGDRIVLITAPTVFVLDVPESKCSVRLLEAPVRRGESRLPVIKPAPTEKMPLAVMPAPPCPKP